MYHFLPVESIVVPGGQLTNSQDTAIRRNLRTALLSVTSAKLGCMTIKSDGSKQSKTLNDVASDKVIDAAYRWLCHRRQKHPHNADIWDLRWRWTVEKSRIQHALLHNHYRFSPLDWFLSEEGEVIERYSARDALVLKALTLVLTPALLPRLSPACCHLKGHGGITGALRRVRTMLPAARFVCRSDVRGYYANINHDRLEAMLENDIGDKRLFNLLRQYLRRCVCRGENYRDIKRGIPLRAPLSPLMGALYLLPLDQAMARHKVTYVRFMDDWVILSPNRGRLCRAVATMNRVLSSLGLEQHPDKTFIGRIERGFDFLGVFFNRQGYRVSERALAQLAARGSRLYERGASPKRIGGYLRRWVDWYSTIAEQILGTNSDYFLLPLFESQRTGTTLPFFSSINWMLETAAPDPLP